MRLHTLLLICACTYAHAAVTNLPLDSIAESTVNYHEEIEKCNSEEDVTTVSPKFEPQKEALIYEIGIQPLTNNQVSENLTGRVITEGLYDNTDIIPEIYNLTETYNNSILNHSESSDEIVSSNETSSFDPIEVLMQQHEKYHSIINQYKTEFEKLLELKEIERHMYEKRIAHLERLLLEKRYSSELNEDTSQECDCPCMRAKRDLSRKRSISKELKVGPKTGKLNSEEFFKYMEKMNRKHVKALQKIRNNFKALYEASSSSESTEINVTSREIKRKIEEIKKKYNLISTPEVVPESQLNSKEPKIKNVEIINPQTEDILVESSIEAPLHKNTNIENTKIDFEDIVGEITINEPKNIAKNVEPIIHIMPRIEPPLHVAQSEIQHAKFKKEIKDEMTVNLENKEINKENKTNSQEEGKEEEKQELIANTENKETTKENETKSQEDGQQEEKNNLFGFGISFNFTDGFKVHWNDNWPKTGPVNNRPMPNGGYIPNRGLQK